MPLAFLIGFCLPYRGRGTDSHRYCGTEGGQRFLSQRPTDTVPQTEQETMLPPSDLLDHFLDNTN